MVFVFFSSIDVDTQLSLFDSLSPLKCATGTRGVQGYLHTSLLLLLDTLLIPAGKNKITTKIRAKLEQACFLILGSLKPDQRMPPKRGLREHSRVHFLGPC